MGCPLNLFFTWEWVHPFIDLTYSLERFNFGVNEFNIAQRENSLNLTQQKGKSSTPVWQQQDEVLF